MSKKKENDGFRTHIPEPRWQQIASVILAVGFLIFIILIATAD